MSAPPLRVVNVCQPTTGGVAVCVRDLTAGALERGVEASVISPAEGDLPGWIDDIGATWTEVPMARAPGPADLLAARRLRDAVGDADVVHLHSSKAGALGRLGRQRGGPAVAYTPHGWGWLVGGTLAPAYRAVERLLAARADRVVAVSEEDRRDGAEVLGRRADRLVVIPNGVDTGRFAPEGPVASRSEDPLVVFVGRLSRQKAPDLAVEAMALLADDNARLRLVGEGPDREAVADAARHLGVADRVELVGTADPSPHLRAADVVIVPSRWDAQSLSLLEAMASGASVVATAVAGSAALGDAGAVVPVDDVDALARAVERRLADPALRATEGRDARARALDGHRLEDMVDTTVGLWHDLAGTNSARAVTTAVEARTLRTVGEVDRPATLDRAARPVVAVAVACLAVGLGGAVSQRPLVVTTVVLGLVTAALVTRHLTVAVGVLIASFSFDAYLGSGLVSGAKAIGVVAVAAWLIDAVLRGRPVRGVPLLVPIGVMGLLLIPPLAVAEDQSAAMVFATRYLMFFTLAFLVVQATADRPEVARRLGRVAVWAAAGAAALGPAAFLTGAVDRASGPIGDPNDFAFVLASVVPLSLWLRSQWCRAARWNPYTLTTALLLGAVLATLSRGAFVALAVAGAWAVATRRLPLRHGIAAVATLAAVAGTIYLVNPTLVDDAVERKSVVAEQNVSSRVEAWEVTLMQARSAPLTGVGPGNFVPRYEDFAAVPDTIGGEPITTHNAYLNVVAELGLPGLAAFVAYLAVAWGTLRRRDGDTDGFRSALAGGFLVAVVGALFLTQQFYAPLWLLPALGAGAAGALDPERAQPAPTSSR